MTKSIKRCRRLLALLLVVVIVSGSTYRARAAAVLPEVVVSGGEALAYLLGILGLTAGGSYVIDNKDDLISWGNTQIGKLKDWTKENSDKVNAWGAATSQEIESSIDAWFEKLRTGTLDTASAVWDSIKAWGGSIYDKLHALPSASDSIGAFKKISAGRYSYMWDTGGLESSLDVDSSVYVASMYFTKESYSSYYLYLISPEPFKSRDSYTRSLDNTKYYNASLKTVGGTEYYVKSIVAGVCSYERSLACDLPPTICFDGKKADIGGDVLAYLLGVATDVPSSDYTTVGGVSDIYDRDKSLDNIGVAVPGIAAGATDIPIDWGLVGDIAGTLTDVRAGVKDIADVLADAKVFPIDKTRDTVIDSDGDLSNDKAKDDVIPAVPNVGTLDDYKLAGLEKVFPFCIPFDLIAFLGCLSAAPEAPAFDWVFPLPGKDGKEYTLHVDLSPWEPVAKIARTMETLAFCIGLVMITREKMIVS